MMERGAYSKIAVLQLVTAVGLILFWTAFFTVGLAPDNPPPGYFVFEHSFPLPDILLAVALLRAATLLLSGDEERIRSGRHVSLVAAGGLLFLGLIDFSFNIQNGMYTISVTDGVVAAFIQVWCVGMGLVLIRHCAID